MQQQINQHVSIWQQFRALCWAILSRWYTVISRDEVAIVEIIFGFGTMIWGLFLFGPWEAFSSPGWALVQQTGIPENVYGAVMVMLGALISIEIPYRRAHIAITFLLFLAWGLIWLALLWVNPATTGTPMYGFMTIVHAGIFVRRLSDPKRESRE